jgi:hypothetical protein
VRGVSGMLRTRPESQPAAALPPALVDRVVELTLAEPRSAVTH